MTRRDRPDETLAVYCGSLGLPAAPPGSSQRAARLRQIARAHLARVPYENVSKWLAFGRGVPAAFDAARFVRELREHGLGGTCFRLAVACAYLLRGLGYDAALVSAPAGGHAAVVVTLAGDRYLVDVGFFAPFWEPVPLTHATTWQGALGTFEVAPHGEEVTLRRPSGTTRLLALQAASEAEVWGQWADSCVPGHRLFPRAVVLQRVSADTAWSLFDLSLHTVTAAGLQERTLTRAAARRVVRDIFGVDADLWDEALALRERLAAAQG